MMDYRHHALRHGIAATVENEMVADPRTQQDMKMGTVFTSVKPFFFTSFRCPFSPVTLKSQLITLDYIADQGAKYDEQRRKLRDVFSTSSHLEKRNLREHKISFDVDHHGEINLDVASHGGAKGKVEDKVTVSVDFGILSQSHVDPAKFHEAVANLKIDPDRWNPLKLRHPKSLYVVVRLEMSDKLICDRTETQSAGGELGVKGVPALDVGSKAGSTVNSELNFERDTKGVIGYKLARLHVDKLSNKLSLVDPDFSSSGRVDRQCTDGLHASPADERDREYEEYMQSLKQAVGNASLRDVLARWNTAPPSLKVLDFVEAAVFKIVCPEDMEDLQTSMSAASATGESAVPDEASEVLKAVGIAVLTSGDGGEMLDWSGLPEEKVSGLQAVPALIAVAQGQHLSICAVPEADEDAVRGILSVAAIAPVPEFDAERIVPFKFEPAEHVSDRTWADLNAIGIQKMDTGLQYRYGRLRPATLHLLASLVGIFN